MVAEDIPKRFEADSVWQNVVCTVQDRSFDNDEMPPISCVQEMRGIFEMFFCIAKQTRSPRGRCLLALC